MTKHRQANSEKLKVYLETLFSRISTTPYDKKATSLFLENIEVLYPTENPVDNINLFFEEYSEELKKVMVCQESISPFFFQPEILIILERLKNKHSLRRYWESIYPIEDLVSIANTWGVSLD